MQIQITSRPDGTELTNEDVLSGDTVVWQYEQMDGIITRCAYIDTILREVPDVPTVRGLYESNGDYYQLLASGWYCVLDHKENRPSQYKGTAAMEVVHAAHPLRRLVPES